MSMRINWFQRWSDRRARARSQRAIMKMILDHIEAGGDLDDLFIVTTDRAVEWNQRGGYWFVYIDPIFAIRVGQRVALSNGRGGAYEEPRVAEALGDDLYRLDYS